MPLILASCTALFTKEWVDQLFFYCFFFWNCKLFWFCILSLFVLHIYNDAAYSYNSFMKSKRSTGINYSTYLTVAGDTIWRHRSGIDIGSGNGLLPDDANPLPEPMLTYQQWDPLAYSWGQIHSNSFRAKCLKFTYLNTNATSPGANV